MSRRTQALVLLFMAGLSLTACGSRRRAAQPLSPVSSNEDADQGLHGLRKSLESTVLENYTQLTYGNIEAVLDGVAIDREIQLIGVTPRDLVVGVNPPGLSEDRRLYRTRGGLRLLSKNLDVHVSQDGSVGWVFDEVSYRVEYIGREASIPIRSTAVYIRDVDRWVLVAEHLSYGVPAADAIDLAARDELVAGTKLRTGHGQSKTVAADLMQIVSQFLAGDLELASPPRAGQTLVLLPGPEQEFHGTEGAENPLLAEYGENARVDVRNFRMQLASSKRVAWIVAKLVIRTERNGDQLKVPLRASFVLERRRKEDWAMVQAHVSVPLLEQQVSERVFGPLE